MSPVAYQKAERSVGFGVFSFALLSQEFHQEFLFQASISDRTRTCERGTEVEYVTFFHTLGVAHIHGTCHEFWITRLAKVLYT